MKKQHKKKRGINSLNKLLAYLPVLALLLFITYKGNTYLTAAHLSPFSRNTAYAFNQYPCSLVDHSEEHPDQNPRFSQIYSATYQQKISDQQSDKNLVTNGSLAATDKLTSYPAGFTPANAGSTNKQTVISENGQSYLHTELLGVANENTMPTWIFDEIKINNEAYGFSFYYRSDQPANLTIEYHTPSGEVTYESFAELPPTTEWQKFSGHFDNSQAKATTLRFNVTPSAAGTLDTRSYAVFPIKAAGLDEGIISVAFDDGWQSVYDYALPILDKYDIKTTQYIIAEYSVNPTKNYMTTKEIRKMAEKGHEIGAHSIRHCDLTTITIDQLHYEATESKAALQKNKIAVSSFAHPFGSYSSTTLAVLSEEYDFIRSTDRGLNDAYFDPINIHTETIESTTTLDEVRDWIDAAEASKKWLVLTYHRVGEEGSYNVTPSQLEEQAALIKSSGLKIMPIVQAAEFIKSN